MVCYAVPLAAMLISFIGRKVLHRDGVHGFSLNIMLLGGSTFGFIDHLWNGELLMIGPNLASDMALGFTITGGILAGWGVITYKAGISSLLHRFSSQMGILRK
jgi:hypothetical protein